MKFLTTMLCALLIAVAGTPADAGERKDAGRLCKSELRAYYKANGFNGVTVVENRRGKYKVEGFAERNGRRDNWFTCKVRDRRVSKVSIGKWQRGSSGNSGISSDDAAGAIVGALIGAAILGAISSDYENDDYHGYDNSVSTSPDFRKNWGNSYQPQRGVTCYRGQQACYKDGGGYNATWTDLEFGGK